ncbi:MAG TPA: hypothetical protein VHJ99_07260 [Candidatus Dormibacteraeota bacterium]|nr:hypothetical protein [Candidatus Dormibacteraeota bacterium]
MRSRKVGGFRPFARAGAIASIALIGMVFSANAAFAATVIGSAAGTVTSTSAGFDTVQISWSSGTYAVPAGGGFITLWSTQAGPLAGPVGLQVWRPTTTAGTYLLVGASPLVTLTPSMMNDIPLLTRIPVQEGDLLGLRIEGRATYGQYTSSATDTYGSKQSVNPAVGVIDTFTNNTFFQLDVAATVEPAITPPPPPPPPPTGCGFTGVSTGDDVCIQ